MGGASIREFALPLMVGIVCGTYSSVCLAGSLWFEMNRRREKALAAAKEEARAREKEAREKKKNKKKQ